MRTLINPARQSPERAGRLCRDALLAAYVQADDVAVGLFAIEPAGDQGRSEAEFCVWVAGSGREDFGVGQHLVFGTGLKD